MRISSLLVAVSFLFISAPVFAGSVTYADMRGKWQPTGCTPPSPVVISAKDSEIPADDLNGQYAQKNKFISEAHEYMLCISKDAQKDAEAVGILVTKSAQAIIDKTQAEIDAAIASAKGPASN